MLDKFKIIINNKMNSSTPIKAMGLLTIPAIGNVPNEIRELSIPNMALGENDVFIEVKASALHIDDIALAQGTALGRFLGPKHITPDEPYVMGSNFSGVIQSIGNGVTKFKIGDEVIGIPASTGNHGEWATHINAKEASIRLKPLELTHKEAAALILGGCVAYGMLLNSKVKKGDECLVIGASGGIGSALTQMLKAKGAVVTAVCSSRNLEAVKANGADYVIDYMKNDFHEYLKTHGKRMNLVFDTIGGIDAEKESMKILLRKGKFLTVCGPQKYIGSKKLSWPSLKIFFFHIIAKTITSFVVGPRYIFSDKRPNRIIDEMFQFVVEHDIKMPLDSIIPLETEAVKQALIKLTEHRVKGRIVIDMTLNQLPI